LPAALLHARLPLSTAEAKRNPMSAFPVEAGRIADLETPLQTDANDPQLTLALE
jgi:hypothetical protein